MAAEPSMTVTTIAWDVGAPDTTAPPAPPKDLYFPEIIVLITSAPWRRASLAAVLRALATQTRRADRVLLVLDGVTTLPDEWSSPITVEIEARETSRGPGARWQHPALDVLAGDAIVVTLDDDLVPEPSFIDWIARACLERNCVITGHGWTPPGTKGELRETTVHDLDVIAFGSGVAAGRWRWLSPVRQHPLARIIFDGFGPAADDDALLALDLWERGVRVVRPAGRVPVTERPESTSETSGAVVHGYARTGQRVALAMLTGAPICELVFPVPPQSARAFRVVLAAAQAWTTTTTLVQQDVLLTRNLHLALTSGARPFDVPFVEQIEPHLRALRPGMRVAQIELGPWSYWLELYCYARGIHLVTRSSVPELRARWRELNCGGDLVTALDATMRFALVIVSPYHRPGEGVMADAVTELR